MPHFASTKFLYKKSLVMHPERALVRAQEAFGTDSERPELSQEFLQQGAKFPNKRTRLSIDRKLLPTHHWRHPCERPRKSSNFSVFDTIDN